MIIQNAGTCFSGSRTPKMRNYKCSIVTICFILISSISGHADDRPSVFVSIVPQKYFVQQIGKDLVEVQVMVKPGASPAAYEPKPRQMAEISAAKAYFAIGVPFETAWLKKIAAANPGMQVVRTDHGIRKIAMATHHHAEPETHHDDRGEHAEDGHALEDSPSESGILDPHIWLSPPLVKIQAHAILNTLMEIDPSHAAVYETNYRQFITRIDALDARLKKTLTDRQGFRFMVFHPSWGYFAETYRLKQIPIEIEGKDPKPAQLKEIIETAKQKEIKVVFVQPQFSTKSAKLVAGEIDGQVVFADPLAEDWHANLMEVADKFAAALK